MAILLKPGWSKPSTILFATEFPPNERLFTFTLTQALETGASLVLFHAYQHTAFPDEAVGNGVNRSDFQASRVVRKTFESLAERAKRLDVKCRVVARPGPAADAILTFLQERRIDRVVLGARTPGPVGKLLVGSVAETVLRRARVPVSVVGPCAVEGASHFPPAGTIVCSVSNHPSSRTVALFAAELALQSRSRLLLQHIIPPQEADGGRGGKLMEQAERDLRNQVPARLRDGIRLECKVGLGDPTEDLLYQGRVEKANLIVLGAHEASHFAAVTPAGFLYQILAYARCPVLTLSPVVLNQCAAKKPIAAAGLEDHYLAGVI